MWMDWNAMGLLGWTMMILLWAAVLVAIIWAIRGLSTRPSAEVQTPLELLERRFAAGEIDPEDFAARKELLSRN